MKIKHPGFAAALLLLFSTQLHAQLSSNTFWVNKFHGYYDSFDGERAFETFSAGTIVDESFPTNVILTLPNFTIQELSPFASPHEFKYFEGFEDGSMNTVFPPGSYQFTINSASTQYLATLNLSSADPLPRPILSHQGKLAADVDEPLIISWTTDPVDSTNYHVHLRIAQYFMGTFDYVNTPLPPFEMLSGSLRQITVPAGTLPPGNLIAELTFYKITDVNTNDIPGAVGVASYSTRESFEIQASPSNTNSNRGIFNFEVSSFSCSETAGETYVTVTRSGGIGPATVRVKSIYSAGKAGFADTFVDYLPFETMLFFKEGVSSLTVPIKISDDSRMESAEAVRLQLSHPSVGSRLGVRSNAVVLIRDNEKPSAGTIQLRAATTLASEGTSVAKVHVSRIGGPKGNVSVGFVAQKEISAAISNKAEPGEDFEITTGTITFKTGETNKVISIPLINDAVIESNEVFSVSLSYATGGAGLGARSQGLVRILNDDKPGVVNFGNRIRVIDESGTNVVLSLVRTGGKAPGVSVEYSTEDRTAFSFHDYADAGNTRVTFGDGETTKLIAIPIYQDSVDEPNERFAVRLVSPEGGLKIGTNHTAIVTIVDDDL